MAKEPLKIPPPPDYLSVPFGQAISEGFASHAGDLGAAPETASKLGDVFSNTVQLNPVIGATAAVTDAANAPNPENIWNVTQTGLSALNPLAKLQKLGSIVDEASTPQPLPETIADAVQPKIKAYHGSPHEIQPEPGYPMGRFRDEKIGTGEGAQVYGRGHYLAEEEQVGKKYRDMLSPLPGGKTIHEKLAEADDYIEEAALEMLHREEGDIDAAIRYLETPAAQHDRVNREAADYLKANREALTPQGHMYEAEIQADPEHFLNWDVPLSQHPEQIRERLTKMLAPDIERSQKAREAILARGTEGFGRFVRPLKPEKIADLQKPIDPTGEGIYKMLRKRENPNEPTEASDIAAANALKEAGFPGIRYLDEGSRKGPPIGTDMLKERLAFYEDALVKNPNGPMAANVQREIDIIKQNIAKAEAYAAKPETRNYVVFDPAIINIVRKYGIAGALGAGLITEQMADQMRAQGMEG